MTSKLRVGIAGGGIGKSHIDAYQSLPDLFEVAAFCDVDPAISAAVATSYNIPYATTAFNDLCDRGDLDIIDICTPSFLHGVQSRQALDAGKHVICEKPVGSSLRDIDQLAEIEAASGKRLMPIFQKRYGHGLQKLKHLQALELTGPAYLTTVETAWRRRAEYYAVPWRGKWATELGGALTTLAIHAHDVLCYVLGPVRSVQARAKTAVNDIETEDCVVAALEMADGSLASLAVTTGSAVQVSRHRFCFRRLTAESNTSAYENTSDPWRFDGDDEVIQMEIDAALATFDPLPEGFAGQFYRFHQALTQDLALPVTLADARMAAELITAVYESAASGKPVEFPLSPEHPRYADWR